MHCLTESVLACVMFIAIVFYQVYLLMIHQKLKIHYVGARYIFQWSMYNSFHISGKYSTTLSNTIRTGPGLSDWVFLMPPMCGLKFRQERIQVEIILTWPINGSNKALGSL